MGNRYVDSGYVCAREDGRMLNPQTLSNKFKAFVSASELPVYRFHDLRHSSASLLLANGCSLKEIGAWLGHSSISTTNRYAHLQYKATIEMANSVEDSLFASKSDQENPLEQPLELAAGT